MNGMPGVCYCTFTLLSFSMIGSGVLHSSNEPGFFFFSFLSFFLFFFFFTISTLLPR